MRRYLLSLLIIVLLLTACQEEEAIYKPGFYRGQAEGYHSIIEVEVEVDEYNILEITIVSHEEPDILADIVMDKIPKQVIKKNSTDVDIVSGATLTSERLLLAIENALKEARINND